MKNGRSKGFTLVELLVVIAIIAVLAGLLLPALTKAKAASLQVKCVSNLKQYGVYLQIYVSEYSKYPVGISDGKLISGETEPTDPVVYHFFSKRHSDLWKWPLRCPAKGEAVWKNYEYNRFPNSILMGAFHLNLAGEVSHDGAERIVSARPETAVVNPADMIAYTEMVSWRMLPMDTNTWVTEFPVSFADRALSLPENGSTRFTPATYGHRVSVNQLFCDGHVASTKKTRVLKGGDDLRRRWFTDNQPHRELAVHKMGIP